MSKSNVLSWKDVDTLLDMLGEAWSARAQGLDWRARMLERISTLVNAQMAIFAPIANWRGGQPKDPVMPGVIVFGHFEPEQRCAYAHHAKVRGWRRDPTARPLAMLPGAMNTVVRRQLATDREWYSNSEMRETRFDVGIDDMLFSALEVPRVNMAHVITLHRAAKARPFNEHERRLVEALHRHGHGLFESDGSFKPLTPTLSRRERETLGCFLRGDSAKQAARRLGVSVHTINTYAKALHRKFGVSSRGELLVCVFHCTAAGHSPMSLPRP